MSRAGLFVASVFCLAAGGAATVGAYGVGRPATSEEVRRLDISVSPDGAGLPEGRGSAREGEGLYAARCAACHGAKGEGHGDFPALVGGSGTLTTSKPVATVGSFWPYATTAWDYINRAMPYDQPGSLSVDEVYAITAFVLRMNGIVGDEVLTQKTLPEVRMPNRGGFVPDPRPDVGHGR